MRTGHYMMALCLIAGVVSSARLARAGASTESEAAGKGPTAVADTAVAAIGQQVRVHGSGWGSDRNEVVRVVLCGNDALDGAADCDPGNTAEGGIRQGGDFLTVFKVAAPLLPCPCVLRASSRQSATDVKIPISIVGAPTAPPQQRVSVRRAVSVDGVRVEGRGPWTSWFGASPHRTLVYRVTNTGDVALHNPPLDASWGKGSNRSGFIPAPPVGDLAVNATRTFRADIPFPALSFGSYRAVVTVDPFGTPGSGEATTKTTPWGLVVAGPAGLALHRTSRCLRRSPSIHRLWRPAAVPGWYLDPISEAELRLWDGRAWTEATLSLEVPLTCLSEDSP